VGGVSYWIGLFVLCWWLLCWLMRIINLGRGK
jgi:hypothetical protein